MVAEYPHRSNLEHKESGGTKGKYADEISVNLLGRIRIRYDKWCAELNNTASLSNEETEADPSIIQRHVSLFNEYKDFIDQKEFAEHFDSRSALHGSALEEFFTHIFKDVVDSISDKAIIGSVSAMKDIFFTANSFTDLLTAPEIKIEKKNHDFAIGANVTITITPEGVDQGMSDNFNLPSVVIECKTYLDKTMLEGCATSAEQLKLKNPNAMYIIASEWMKLTDAVNLAKYPSIDQIFCLRKQKNTDREDRFAEGYVKNPIYPDVVWMLFTLVRDHLTQEKDNTMQALVDRGYLKD